MRSHQGLKVSNHMFDNDLFKEKYQDNISLLSPFFCLVCSSFPVVIECGEAVDYDGYGQLENEDPANSTDTSHKLAQKSLWCNSMSAGSDVHQREPERVEECPDVARMQVGVHTSLSVVVLPLRAFEICEILSILHRVEQAGKREDCDHDDDINK